MKITHKFDNMKMSSKELLHFVVEKIKYAEVNINSGFDENDRREIQSISKILLSHLFDLNNVDYILDKVIEIPDKKYKQLHEIISRVLNNEPIQYIIGNTEFFGLQIKTDPRALIPRPETEEMVFYINNVLAGKKISHILDICTGTGCIALALKKIFPSSTVYGLDISEEALSLAQQNNIINDYEVNFKIHDIITQELNYTNIDLIVSNPPYIEKSDKICMKKNVLNYEPHLALFVDDNDPLLFYEKIIKKSRPILNTPGYIFVEINENYGSEVHELFSKYHYSNIIIHKDIHERERWVSAMVTNI